MLFVHVLFLLLKFSRLLKGQPALAGDNAGRLNDTVPLPEVPAPHVLVGNLQNVRYWEPAFLSVRQPDALIAT